MLGKKNEEVRISTLLGQEAEINGDFNTSGSARMDGTVNGNVTVSGTLILGAGGCINGNIEADAVLIGGEVLGNIMTKTKAELTGTARVFGDIITSVIVIDEHAVFQGKCDMHQDVNDKRARNNAAKAARASRKSAKAAIAEALKDVEEGRSEIQTDQQTASQNVG